MPAPNSISPEKLSKLVGTPRCPVLIDFRDDEDYEADPSLVPGSFRFSPEDPSLLKGAAGEGSVVALCQLGHRRSQGPAAWLRHEGIQAEYLEGGFVAWRDAGLPVTDPSKLPPRDAHGRTIWVTRARPKIDRIACPWLIRRFVDRRAVFLFVAPSEVAGVAERLSGAPYDIEDVFWSHRGERCTFDVMVQELGLTTEPLEILARIIRGADTARLDLAPEAAGLLAASLGLSRMYSDDNEQLEAGMLLYDTLYRWARDAIDETHNWPTNKPKVQA